MSPAQEAAHRELAEAFEHDVPKVFAAVGEPQTPEQRQRMRELLLMALARLDVLDGVRDGNVGLRDLTGNQSNWMAYFVAFVVEFRAKHGIPEDEEDDGG